MKRAFIFLFILIIVPQLSRAQFVTPEFELRLKLTQTGGGGNTDPVGFGFDTAAATVVNDSTLGYDTAFGESYYPGTPFDGGYFLAFQIDPSGDYSEIDILHKPDTTSFVLQYTLNLSAFAYPATLSWNASQIPSAIKAITITPISEPNFILANMTTQSSVTITDNPSDSTYYSNWEPAIITLYYNTAPPSLGVSNPQTTGSGLISGLAAYPNPMQSSGAVAFMLSQPAGITVTGYDALGREVLNITKDEPSGQNTIDLSSAMAAHSGALFLRVNAESGGQHETGSVMLVKE